LKFERPTLSSGVTRSSDGQGVHRLPGPGSKRIKLGGKGRMQKEVSAVEETVTTFVEDGLNASQLSAMNPSELFRLAAELGLAIETMPSSSSQELRLNRYIE
jgi:hypothetical protein